MIVVNIKGGLGNQLFQYSLGRNLAIKNNCELLLDISFYDSAKQYRSFQLDQFDTNFKIAPAQVINKYKNIANPDLNRYYNYSRLIFDSYSESRMMPFNPNILEKTFGYFDGYWQTEKYFIDIENIIKTDLTPRHINSTANNIFNKICSTNSASIHIRKADFLIGNNSLIYENCSKNYYTSAINYLMERYQNLHFFIFSDDFDWVKGNLDLTCCQHEYIMTDNLPHEDMYLMSQCNHNIIANSTFSWWSGWLNSNPGKQVISPKKWFKGKLTEISLVPENWVRISN